MSTVARLRRGNRRRRILFGQRKKVLWPLRVVEVLRFASNGWTRVTHKYEVVYHPTKGWRYQRLAA